jgi:transcriptional regulator with XRE-family HTH domain
VQKNVRLLCVRIIALLQQERLRRKLSKYFVAQKSGLSPQMIAYVEDGTRNPTLETVLRIAAALEVDFAALVKKARRSIPKAAK